MSITSFLIIIAVFIILMFIYKRADKAIKKMDPKVVKKLNWVGFVIGIAGGIAWYLFHNGIYMLVTLAGVVVYFLFYGYDRMEEEQKQ